ncbi:hypothetical protein B0H14DRAFT_3554196 [Mycena olivaceomarginata]|nr:hypothetical protein B0H14DRAFT_3554196 [Mycena olivaceomarginata]
MYPGSGGFSPAVRNLSSGALDYWIECSFASRIEFMYPGSAGLIATPAEPNPSSAALDYCSEHNLASCVDSIKSFRATRMMNLRVAYSWPNDSNKEGQPPWEEKNPKARGLFSPQGTVIALRQALILICGCSVLLDDFQHRTTCNWGLVHDDQRHKEVLRLWGLEGLASCDLCLGSGGLRSWFGNLQLLFGSWPGKLRPSFGFWGLRTWPGKLRLQFGFWGLEVVAWQAATSVWASGGIGVVALQASCDSLLGSGGLRSWTEVATSVWASGGIRSWPGKLRLLFGHQGTSGSSAGKLRPMFGLWGLDVVAWQAVTSVWVLGEQIAI